LLAGGIGVTPLMSMLKSLAHHGSEAPVYFLHAARDGRVHALAEEARDIAAERPNIRTHVRYDAPRADDLREKRCDSAGLVDRDFLREWLPTHDADFYFCGPKPFMAGVYRWLKESGVDDSRIHFEFFGPRQEIAMAT
jgi:nitric oxide dioxygenase